MTPRKIQAGNQLHGLTMERSPSSAYFVGEGVLVYPFPMRWPGLLITSGIKLACEKRAVETGKTYQECLEQVLLHCIGLIELANRSEVQPPFKFDTSIGAVEVDINDMDSVTVSSLVYEPPNNCVAF